MCFVLVADCICNLKGWLLNPHGMVSRGRAVSPLILSDCSQKFSTQKPVIYTKASYWYIFAIPPQTIILLFSSTGSQKQTSFVPKSFSVKCNCTMQMHFSLILLGHILLQFSTAKQNNKIGAIFSFFKYLPHCLVSQVSILPVTNWINVSPSTTKNKRSVKNELGAENIIHNFKSYFARNKRQLLR